jgi:methyl-accepting chemotaxis protein
MISLFRRKAASSPQPERASVPPVEQRSPAPQAEDRPMAGPTEDLVRLWNSLSYTQRRTLEAVAFEISATSDEVESQAIDLSRRFRDLAAAASAQTARVERLIAKLNTIEAKGETVSLAELTKLLDEMLADSIEKVLFLSKRAMQMVYTLADVMKNVDTVQGCIGQIDKINRKTNILALNATIEAKRAGAAGAAFNIVANEVRDLSRTINDISGAIRGQIETVSSSLKSGNVVLEEIATMDMSENILLKERIDNLLEALRAREVSIQEIVNETSTASQDIAGTVSGIVTGMQFQDRCKQRLELVTDSLGVLCEGINRLRAESAALDSSLVSDKIDEGWVNSLLQSFKLSAVKQRFVSQLLHGEKPEIGITESSAGGDIELF